MLWDPQQNNIYLVLKDEKVVKLFYPSRNRNGQENIPIFITTHVEDKFHSEAHPEKSTWESARLAQSFAASQGPARPRISKGADRRWERISDRGWDRAYAEGLMSLCTGFCLCLEHHIVWGSTAIIIVLLVIYQWWSATVIIFNIYGSLTVVQTGHHRFNVWYLWGKSRLC